jgi:rubrerythrin
MEGYLSDCKRIEEIAGEIYQQLSKKEVYTDEVRKTFRQLSDEEKAHARHIDLVLQATENEADVIPTLAAERLDDILANALYLLRKVKQEEMDEATSLQLAAYMEQKFAKVHIQNVLYFNNQKLTKLFDQLGKEDEAHLNILNGLMK